METRDSLGGHKIKLFKLLGIAFQIDLAWLFVFTLLTFSLASQFAKDYPHWSVFHYSIAGVLTCLLFFASIVLHELGHCLVAKASGLPVRSITLFILGGVSQIGREAQRPGVEFLVAAAGPATSILLSSVFGMLWLATEGRLETVAALAEWLAEINVMLAAFNMIPAFPLDGGRILRAALWGIYGDFTRATRLASSVGRGVALLFFSGGILLMFGSYFAYGFWMLFIGWFLWVASRQNESQVAARESLAGVTAGDVMTTDCPRIERGRSLAELYDMHMESGPLQCCLVLDNGILQGIVDWEQLSKVPRESWEVFRVEDAMIPLGKLRSAQAHQDLVKILEAMDREGLRHVPVFGDGCLLGVLGRSRIYHFLQNRLHVSA